MQIKHIEYLLRCGSFGSSAAWDQVSQTLMDAIQSIEWPNGAGGFYLQSGSTGRKRGEGNGVTPIKDAFCRHLVAQGWRRETPVDIATLRQPGNIDVTLEIPDIGLVAVEWETGNISSSHRSLNKLALGLLNQRLIAGIVILPTRVMYKFLTDRVGNYEELSPYFSMWQALPVIEGVLAIIAIEHDGIRPDVPRIPKGTDGRALV
ncbi:MAG: hypothetical protein ACYDBB_08550 [Armatimonadota bacterium]